MELVKNQEKKDIEIWLTNSEKEDKELQARLKSLYHKYKQMGYFVTVFLSGEAELYESAFELLSHNRKCLAQKDYESEGQCGMAMTT